jgi:hypothetical protein
MTLIHHDTNPEIQDKTAEAEEIEVVSFEPMRFGDHAQLQDYKDYLATFIGQEVTLSARETHFIAQLTGFLVTLATQVEFIRVQGQINNVSGRFVEFVTTDDGVARHSLVPYVRIEEAPE